MIKKTLFLSIFFIYQAFAMPDIIQDYQEITIPTASASKMKDIISPTKDILSKADEIYQNEKKDFQATVKIEKYRNLKSKNHAFLIDKKIQLANILSDMTSLNKITQTNKTLNLPKEEK